MTSVRINYQSALAVWLVAAIAYGSLPGVFAPVLRGWYPGGWAVLCLIGLWIAFGFACPSCGLPITLRRMAIGNLTTYGYFIWPPRRCTRCDEPLGD